MHALVTAILLGMAWLDSFNADAQPEPPDRQLAQVEQSVSGSEGNTVIAADAGGQAALLKKPFKHGESVGFFGAREGFTGEQKTAGVIGDRQRIAVLVISQQELAFIVGAPQLVGPLAQRQSGSLSTATQSTAAFDQAMAIEHGMDGTFGRAGNSGEPAQQALTDFASTPAGVLVLYVQDEVFDLERKLVGIAIRSSASVREPLHTAFLITIEDLIAGLAGDAKLPAKFCHRLAG